MENNNTPKKRRGLLYLILLVVASAVAIGVTYSRYVASRQGSDAATVAIPRVVFLTSSPDISDLAPGETQTYEFQVANVDELDEVTDVALEYYFEFSFAATEEGAPELDLTYELYYKPTATATEQLVGMRDDSPNISNPIQIGHSDAETHTFYLEIMWNGTQLDADQYAGVDNVFSIRTHVQQID